MGRLSQRKLCASEKARNAAIKRASHGAKHNVHWEPGLDGKHWTLPPDKRHASDVVADGAACSVHMRGRHSGNASENRPSSTTTAGSVVKLNKAACAIAIVGDAREKIRRTRRVTAKDMRTIVHKVGVPLSTFYRWKGRALRGVLQRKVGSGRRASVSVVNMRNWLKDFVQQHCGFVTIDKIVQEMKRQFHHGCKGSICRLLHGLGFRRVRQRLVPLLTAAHKQRRLQWVNAMLALPSESRFGTGDEVLIHVDEKWFFGTHVRHVWQSSGVIAPALPVISKTHLIKEMFIAAVARPIPTRQFDGAIGMWPITEQKIARYTTSCRQRGEVYEVSCTMDTAKFVNTMQTLIIPAALRKCGAWARHITIQFDNAGGHGGGRGDIGATTIATLNNWAATLPPALLEFCGGRQPVIVCVAQPPRSPDLNVLDLGAWHSLQVAVDNFKHLHGIHTDNVDQVRQLVLQTWTAWTSEATLSSLFNTLDCIFHLIHDVDGGNNYNLKKLHHK